MNYADLALRRLFHQHLNYQKYSTPKELVGWMGAVQAQDYSMSKWALGVRMPTVSDRSVEAALDRGEIIRTHLLRPTWHFVAAEDLRWMLRLTAPHIQSSMKSRLKALELTKDVLSQSRRILEIELDGGKHLVREVLVAAFEKAGIVSNQNRAWHLLLQAELEGLICSGASLGNKQTYALLDERVANAAELSIEEALARLAERYFQSHSPATMQDFAWWSGLPAAAVRQAFELVKQQLVSVVVGKEIFWMCGNSSFSEMTESTVYLLPAYDEFIISYKSKQVSMAEVDHPKAVSNNGLFRPILVVDGQVTGTWKRTMKKGVVQVEPVFFKSHPHAANPLVAKAVENFGRFLDRKATVALPES